MKPGNRSIGPQAPKESETKVFNDSIHGHIELHPVCVKIVDTVQFQRLRNIKQLGGCYYVYPGASHNRFEHSIGVCHLAGELARTLSTRQPELDITATDILCVEIAGLCHDLGHGPFSHLFDQQFIPKAKPGHKWKHEVASVEMFNHLLEENEDVRQLFQYYGLGERDIEFIKEQINGPLAENVQVASSSQNYSESSWPYKGRGYEKSFLYEIVANKKNGIDVDKWDYFARDSYHLGIKQSFDHCRFMTFVRVLTVDGEKQICPRDKESGNLYEMFHTRSRLHRRAYQHKTTKVIEMMISEAFLKADQYLMFEDSKGKLLKMSDTIGDMTAYQKVNDSVFERILWSSERELEPARHMLQRILKRNLYKYIAESSVPSQLLKEQTVPVEKVFIQEIVNEADSAGESGVRLKPEDLRVQLIAFNYGMKDENPMDHVRFYRKNAPDEAIEIRKEQVSQMLPQTFQEHIIRLFCTNTTTPRHAELASTAFQFWCDTKGFKKPRGIGMSPDMTPLKAKRSSDEPTDSSARKNLKL